MTDEKKCAHATVIIGSYQRGNVNVPVELKLDDEGVVVNFQFEDQAHAAVGELSDPVFYCQDCGAELQVGSLIGKPEPKPKKKYKLHGYICRPCVIEVEMEGPTELLNKLGGIEHIYQHTAPFTVLEEVVGLDEGGRSRLPGHEFFDWNGTVTDETDSAVDLSEDEE